MIDSDDKSRRMKDPDMRMDPQIHRIRRLAAEDRPPLTAYHYTREAALKGILGARAIWATDMRDLADPEELRYTLSLVRNRLQAHRARTDLTTPQRMLMDEWIRAHSVGPDLEYYVASFCTDRDSLSQWRGYAYPDGYALGLDQMHLLFVAKAYPGAMLVECIYDEASQNAALDYAMSYLLDSYQRQLPQGLPNQSLITEFGAHFFGHVLFLATSFKRTDFSSEKEWRLVIRGSISGGGDSSLPKKIRMRNGKPVRYIEIPIVTETRPTPIAKLIVGPNADPSRAMGRATSLLAEHGFTAREVATSLIRIEDVVTPENRRSG